MNGLSGGDYSPISHTFFKHPATVAEEVGNEKEPSKKKDYKKNIKSLEEREYRMNEAAAGWRMTQAKPVRIKETHQNSDEAERIKQQKSTTEGGSQIEF